MENGKWRMDKLSQIIHYPFATIFFKNCIPIRFFLFLPRFKIKIFKVSYKPKLNKIFTYIT